MIFAVLLLASIAYQLLALGLLGRFLRHEVEAFEGAGCPGVTMLKPVHGLGSQTEACLRSCLRQAYPGECQLVFAASRQGDPALELVRDLGQVVEGGPAASNRKVAGLMAAWPGCRHDLVVVSDADMWMPPDYLSRVVAPFQDPQVGGATCLYAVRSFQTAPQALEGLCITDFCTSVLVARQTEGVHFALGATMAFRRQALERIGGFEAVKNMLADDFQLGYRVAQAGYRMAIAPVVVESVAEPGGWRDVWLHQLRWMVTSRVSRPGGHFAFIVTQGLIWALALLWASGGAGWAWALAGGWLGVRLTCGWFAQLWLGSQLSGRVWMLPLKDALYALLWLLSFTTNRVVWAGRVFKVHRDGTITPAQTTR